MDWQHRLPNGVGDLRDTADGFEANVSMPVDADGYFGRRCPSCKQLFKMSAAQYRGLPDETRLMCPYCGHRDETSEFITEEQYDRAFAAARAVGEQFVHQQLHDMLEETFGRSSRRPSQGWGVEVSYTPAPAPPVRMLPDVIEDKVRRSVVCARCAMEYAVYGPSAFCPVCGPRPATERVVESIAAGRASLELEAHLPADQREQLRAEGVFAGLAASALKNVVTHFEVFARDQFTRRVSGHEALLKGKGNIFQRLDDAAQLFLDHAQLDLRALAGPQRWQRLHEAFARRHVLTHHDGVVDVKFLAAMPQSGLAVGQRLVITRGQATEALDDVETLVRALDQA